MTSTKLDRGRLGQFLLERGLLGVDALDAALSEQRATGKRLPRILSDRAILDEDRLARTLADHLGLETVNLINAKIHDRVLRLIPPAAAARYGALPLAIKKVGDAEVVYVAMIDPLDTDAIAELQRLMGRPVRVLVGAGSDVDQAILEHYSALADRRDEESRESKDLKDAKDAKDTRDLRESRDLRAQKPSGKTPTAADKPSNAGSGPQRSRPQSSSSLPTGAPPRGAPRPTSSTASTSSTRAVAPRVETESSLSDEEILAANLRDRFSSDPGPSTGQATPVHRDHWTSVSSDFEVDEQFQTQELVSGHGKSADDEALEDSTRDRSEEPPEDLDELVDLDEPLGESFETSVDEPLEETPIPEIDAVEEVEADDDEALALEEPTVLGRVLPGEMESQMAETRRIRPQDFASSYFEMPSKRSKKSALHRDPDVAAMIATTLEVPVEIDDASHPFTGPAIEEVPTGLERTGIIPAINFENDGFTPALADRGAVAGALAGAGDIPTSLDAVRARRDPMPPSSVVSSVVASKASTASNAAPVATTSSPTLASSTPASSTPASSTPASSTPASSTPASSTPASSTPASSTPASSTPASSTPASSTSASSTAASSTAASSTSASNTAASNVPATSDPQQATAAQEARPRGDSASGWSSSRTDRDRVPGRRPGVATVEAIEELEAEPIPILEPSQFPSFAQTRDASSAGPASRFAASRPPPESTSVDDEPTNPRIDTQVIFDVLDARGVPAVEDIPTGEASPLSVHRASEPPPRPLSRDDAARLVARLAAGESLTTAGRAQLLLALGRLFLRKGLLTKEELEDELRRG
ncbi:MAG: hypothetical protein IPK13_06915 [Deltaproteobacteria bacterium]|nr:hypothetical protein [Deltaproteobacteria bacterium]